MMTHLRKLLYGLRKLYGSDTHGNIVALDLDDGKASCTVEDRLCFLGNGGHCCSRLVPSTHDQSR